MPLFSAGVVCAVVPNIGVEQSIPEGVCDSCKTNCKVNVLRVIVITEEKKEVWKKFGTIYPCARIETCVYDDTHRLFNTARRQLFKREIYSYVKAINTPPNMYEIGQKIDSLRLALNVDDSPQLVLEYVQQQLEEHEVFLEAFRLDHKTLNEIVGSIKKLSDVDESTTVEESVLSPCSDVSKSVSEQKTTSDVDADQEARPSTSKRVATDAEQEMHCDEDQGGSQDNNELQRGHQSNEEEPMVVSDDSDKPRSTWGSPQRPGSPGGWSSPGGYISPISWARDVDSRMRRNSPYVARSESHMSAVSLVLARNRRQNDERNNTFARPANVNEEDTPRYMPHLTKFGFTTRLSRTGRGMIPQLCVTPVLGVRDLYLVKRTNEPAGHLISQNREFLRVKIRFASTRPVRGQYRLVRVEIENQEVISIYLGGDNIPHGFQFLHRDSQIRDLDVQQVAQWAGLRHLCRPTDF